MTEEETIANNNEVYRRLLRAMASRIQCDTGTTYAVYTPTPTEADDE